MSFKLDFTGVKEFGALPEDIVYGAEVIESVHGASKSGQPKWRMVLKITSPEEHVGQNLWHEPSLQPQAMWKVMESLKAFGEDVSTETKDFNLEPENYHGRTIGVVVENQEYQGQVRAHVRRLVPVEHIGSAIAVVAMAEEEAAAKTK